MTMMAACERCGGALVDQLPCGSCWEGSASANEVRQLAVMLDQASPEPSASVGSQPRPLTRSVLSRIDDRRAAPALRNLLGHGRASIRGAAVRSLGHSGDRSDVPRVTELLDDEHPGVRSRARSALAELGGREAADALWGSAAALDVGERAEVQAALAWLGDARDFDASRDAAQTLLGAHISSRLIRTTHQGWGAVYAVLRLGEERDAAALVDALIERARSAKPRNDGRPGMPPDLYDAQSVARNLNRRLAERGFSTLAERCDHTITELVRRSRGAETRPPLVPIAVEPIGGRSIPRLGMASLSAEPIGDQERAARFGGQPDWLDEPAWPLAPSGHPMVFLGQLPLLTEPDRTAFIFFSDEVVETWEPLGPGNAVVVQPDAVKPQVPSLALRRGPQLYEPVPQPDRYQPIDKMRPYVRYVALHPGADPQVWEWPELPAGSYPADGHQDWNKIGGTPAFLQGEHMPDGPGWRFGFQFSAGWAGHEFGDVAEC